MPRSGRLGWAEVRMAVLDSSVLALASLAAYSAATHVLARIHSLSTGDDLLGGSWAVIATVFVYRYSYHQSVTAAVSRVAATLVSFVVCLVYLIFLPFHAWALAVLVGVSALALTLIGRPGDAITAGITAAVVLVIAAASPHEAWQQPILRVADTLIGVAVGVFAAWIALRVFRIRPDKQPAPARAEDGRPDPPRPANGPT